MVQQVFSTKLTSITTRRRTRQSLQRYQMDHAKIQRSAFEWEARDQCEKPASISAAAKKETETPLSTERVYSSAFMILQLRDDGAAGYGDHSVGGY